MSGASRERPSVRVWPQGAGMISDPCDDLGVGGRLRWAIKAAGLSARQFSRLMGVSHVTISHWCHERTPIPGPRLPDVERILCVDLEWLMQGRERLSPVGRRTLRALEQLPEDERQRVLQLLARTC